jgi:hypothetical protein
MIGSGLTNLTTAHILTMLMSTTIIVIAAGVVIVMMMVLINAQIAGIALKDRMIPMLRATKL